MKTFVIAEAGINHNGEMTIAKRLIEAAYESGADAIKFQTFKTERLVTRGAAMARYQAENTRAHESQFTMLKRLELSSHAQTELFEHCGRRGIMFLSTPFDEESADALDEMGVKAFKVSSGDITNKGLLQHVARKGKPVFLSTGMSSMSEVDRAVNWMKDSVPERPEITLLHCVSNYPSVAEDSNLSAIRSMSASFGLRVGYSDHTLGMEIAIAAAALGACVIEKHFTLDRNMRGPDHRASLEPREFKKMVAAIRNVEVALGDGVKKPSLSEKEMRISARRSVVTARALKKDSVLKAEDVAVKRPGTGIPPEFAETVVGMRVNRDMESDAVLRWEDLKDA